MAKPIVQTEIITLDDGVDLRVDNQSPAIQQMIEYLDEWRQDEADLSSQLIKTRAAINDIQSSILAALQAEYHQPAADSESTPIV